MRIIAGKLGGRQFHSPDGQRTHPMSDKMRGALFNVLGDISGLTVLDAFAGSGGLAYEAISRGAKSAVAIDSDKSAQRAIAANIQSLDLADQVKLIKASISAWLATTNDTFDLIICDPPYDNLQPNLIAQLTARLKPAGLMILSLPPDNKVELDLNLVTRKDYGDATLHFYRR